VLIFAAAMLLRLCRIAWDYPFVLDPDSGHIVNLAVYFGSGDLNPHVFKYPTLWPYLLFVSYGFYFVFGLLAGLWHSAAGFAGHFVQRPADFHLIGRALFAFFSGLGIFTLYKTCSRKDRETAVWAASFAALSPMLIDLCTTAKVEGILFFLCALAYAAALKFQSAPSVKTAVLCGGACGLAVSSQFTAGPLLAIIPLSMAGGLLNKEKRVHALKLLCVAGAAALAAFALTSPYVFLAWGEFKKSLADIAADSHKARAAHTYSQVIFALIKNNLFFGESLFPVGIFTAAGIWAVWKNARQKLWVLGGMVVVDLAVLVTQPAGFALRYALPMFPAMAILSGVGIVFALKRFSAPVKIVAFLLVFGSQLYVTAASARQLLLPDTRVLAARWIEQNVPAGSSFLLDQEWVSPQLKMSREQAEFLYKKTTKLHHPRSKYYKILLDYPAPKGYRLVLITRDSLDLATFPGQMQWSNAGKEVADISKTPEAAICSAGIDYAATSSYGLNPAAYPQYGAYWNFLKKQTSAAEFLPKTGVCGGPEIRLYRISCPRRGR